MIEQPDVAGTKWAVQPYSPQDLPAIARFFKRHYMGLGAYGDSDLFQWKIIDNSLMPGIINLVKDGDRIASITTVTPKRLFLDGKEIAAGEIADSYTDPDYQRQGMLAQLINQCTQDALGRGIDLVYSTPNHQSIPAYERKGNYLRLPNLHVKSLSLPVNVKPLIQRHTHWLVGSYAEAIAANFAFLGLTVQKAIRTAVSVDEESGIPDDWDEFWQTCLAGYDFLIARDRAGMEWRYFHHPHKYRLFVARSGGIIQGYAVYRIIHDEERSVMSLADYLFRPGRESDLRSVLVHIVDRALRSGVATVSAWCPADNPHFRVFRQFGFSARSDVPVVAFQNELARVLSGRKLRWHFTVSDSDNV